SERDVAKSVPRRGTFFGRSRWARTFDRVLEGFSMPGGLSQALAPHLPLLRRYARALTGSQSSGDAYVRACLQTIVDDPATFPRELAPRVGLYRIFHVLWSGTQTRADDEASQAGRMEQIAQERLAAMPPESRQALLLTAMEGFSESDAAQIMGRQPEDIPDLVGT